MATIEISAQAKRRYNKYHKEHGEEAVSYLIDRAKEADHLEATAEETEAGLTESQEELKLAKKAIKSLTAESQALKKELKLNSSQKSTSQERETAMPAPSDPSVVTVLTQALDSMKHINESYARENERLLKITNFSEYDEKINGLDQEIESLKESGLKLQEKLKASQEKVAGVELKSLEDVEKISQLMKTAEEAAKTLASKDAALADEKGNIAHRDTTITAFNSDNAKLKAEVEELQARLNTQQSVTGRNNSESTAGH